MFAGKVSATYHPLLHAGSDANPGRRNTRLAARHGSDPPPSRPGTASLQAHAARCRSDRAQQVGSVDLARGAAHRAGTRLECNDGPRRSPLCRRTGNVGSTHAGSDCSGRVHAGQHALHAAQDRHARDHCILPRCSRSLLASFTMDHPRWHLAFRPEVAATNPTKSQRSPRTIVAANQPDKAPLPETEKLAPHPAQVVLARGNRQRTGISPLRVIP